MRDRRRWLHGYPHSGRGRYDDRRPRDGAASDAARLVLGGRRAPAVQLGALQRALCGRARNGALVGRGAEALRDDGAGRGASAGHRGGSPGLRRRPDLLRPDASERGLLRRRPLDRGHLPRPGRHSPRRRQGASQPRPRPSLRANRAPRHEGLLPRRYCGRNGPGSTGSADRCRREPRLAPGCHDDARRQGVHRARAGAGASELPRARRLRNGAALERRLDRRRGAQHPRGLLPRPGGSHAGAPPLPRGLAVFLRRPERVRRRPRLLRRAAGRPPLGRVRR